MKKIAVLGSTGSIGRQTLEVISKYPDNFKVELLTCNSRIDLLAEQIKMHNPKYAVVCKQEAYEKLNSEALDVKLIKGYDGILKALDVVECDMVLNALVGVSGMMPTYRAIELGIDVALANKETLVAAGELIMPAAERKGVRIFPVDSEHNAIYQCLQGEDPKSIKRLVLTASGGPFRGMTYDELKKAKIGEALNHPNWNMGKKITIDSATMMNKGFEVLEAKWLFDTELDNIEVVVHPQSIVHSMVEFIDGSVMAQMSNPDMAIPIAYSLFEGKRNPLGMKKLDLCKIGKLTFEEPDCNAFPCLSAAYEAGRLGGTFPAALNAANEVLVDAFLKGRIGFTDIPEMIAAIMDKHIGAPYNDIDEILLADKTTRELAAKLIRKR